MADRLGKPMSQRQLRVGEMVKQVSNGQECGITLKDYIDFQKNDTIEAFSVTSTERSI